MKKFKYVPLLILLYTNVWTVPNPNTDWPCWRGPRGDGLSNETNWNPESLKSNPNILWTINVGQGHSSSAVQGGNLYTMGSSQSGQNGQEQYEEYVVCLDAVTGEERWRYSYNAEPLVYAGPRSTPTLDEARVFALGSKGQLFCLESNTGELIWEKNLVKENICGNCKWGFSTSPVVSGDMIILNLGTAGIALNKETGAVIWKNGYRSHGLSSPVLTEIRGQTVALLKTEFNLYAVQVADGKIVWDYRWPYCDADPVLVNENVYIFGGKPGNKRCRQLIRLTDGSPVQTWKQRKMNVSMQTAIFKKSCVYGITWDKKKHHLQCFDLEAGKVRWEKRLSDWAGFSMAGDYLLLIESDGDLVIVDSTKGKYNEVSRASVLDMNDRKKYPDTEPLSCWTTPVFCNGKIYVRNTYGQIACVDVSL